MIRYTTSLAGITENHLQSPFFVGWFNPPNAEAHLRILQGSSDVVLAIDTATEQVVGFITANTDYVISVFIPLLEVTPDYQGQGIGTELFQRMIDKFQNIYAFDLLADKEFHSFYERFGMQSAEAMAVRNYDRQSCN